MKQDNVKTLVIDKFHGGLTRFRDGDINSGKANFYTSWGYDTFQQSGTLTFLPAATSIAGAVITDCIVAGRGRVESNIMYMYCIGHTGRLYKIQVNNPTTHNPDYDTPVLLATLANSQTFHYGASLDFYQGSSEKIWIGHDAGITKINTDGTTEVNVTASFTANVPRQSAQFVGSLFFTDGNNLAKVDSSEVVTHNVLSPGFPANWQARDLDITPDGRYMVTVVTRNPIGDVLSVTPDTNSIGSTPSLLVYWNGTDVAASSSLSFPSFTMGAYFVFSNYEYAFGYQVGGPMITDTKKVLIVPEFENVPLPNAIGASGDFIGWATSVYNTTTGNLDGLLSIYGTIDAETPVGHIRQLRFTSSLSSGDILRIPFYSPVSLFASAGGSSGYGGTFKNIGTAKSYYSTFEYNGSTTAYGFYSFKNVEDFLEGTGTGVYETQHQVFSQKIGVNEVRVYMEPPAVAALTAFTVDLIGIDGSVITGGSFTFSSANQIVASNDRVKYNPSHAPTSALGVRITNAGYLAPWIHRIEIDYSPAGN